MIFAANAFYEEVNPKNKLLSTANSIIEFNRWIPAVFMNGRAALWITRRWTGTPLKISPSQSAKSVWLLSASEFLWLQNFWLEFLTPEFPKLSNIFRISVQNSLCKYFCLIKLRWFAWHSVWFTLLSWYSRWDSSYHSGCDSTVSGWSSQLIFSGWKATTERCWTQHDQENRWGA